MEPGRKANAPLAHRSVGARDDLFVEAYQRLYRDENATSVLRPVYTAQKALARALQTAHVDRKRRDITAAALRTDSLLMEANLNTISKTDGHPAEKQVQRAETAQTNQQRQLLKPQWKPVPTTDVRHIANRHDYEAVAAQLLNFYKLTENSLNLLDPFDHQIAQPRVAITSCQHFRPGQRHEAFFTRLLVAVSPFGVVLCELENEIAEIV